MANHQLSRGASLCAHHGCALGLGRPGSSLFLMVRVSEIPASTFASDMPDSVGAPFPPGDVFSM